MESNLCFEELPFEKDKDSVSTKIKNIEFALTKYKNGNHRFSIHIDDELSKEMYIEIFNIGTKNVSYTATHRNGDDAEINSLQGILGEYKIKYEMVEKLYNKLKNSLEKKNV